MGRPEGEDISPPAKEVVLDVTDAEITRDLISTANSVGIVSVLTRSSFPRDAFDPRELERVYSNERSPSGGRNYERFAWVEVKGASDVQSAISASRGNPVVVVDCANWKIIPLENLIAEFRRKKDKSKLYAHVRDKGDITLAFSILEKGVDGIVIPAVSLQDAREVLRSYRPGQGEETIELTRARVTRVTDVGNGERVCIDTASQLTLGEGMLVGSKANFFFLVHSETVPSEYIPTRPFRVNAGALHSYILGADGKTRYLSELQAGDNVQLVNSKGTTRGAVVGRIKMERRPLVMIAATDERGNEGTAMLQKAETIRLVRPDGRPEAVTDIKEGDEIVVHVAPSKARHFGGEVDEFILER